MTLSVQCLRRKRDLIDLAPEWDAVAAAQPVMTPFRTSAWARIWWKHYRRETARQRDNLRLFALRDEAGTLVAVAPMMLSLRPGKLPIRTRELQFLGADGNVTELRGMVARPGTEAACLEALLAHLAGQRYWDWVQWRGVPAELAAAIPGFRLDRQLSDFHLDLPATWEGLRAALPRNMKEALRKCVNSLARDGHAAELKVLSQPRELLPALHRLLDLHASRARLDTAVQHADVFAPPVARAFLIDYVREAAKAGTARMFSLEVAGVPVAMRLGFLDRGELYLYYSGYDPEWGRYSVMTSVVAEAIKWAIAEGLGRVNLSTGEDVSKLRWRPARTDFVEGVQPSQRLRGQLALATVDLLRRRRGKPPAPEQVVA